MAEQEKRKRKFVSPRGVCRRCGKERAFQNQHQAKFELCPKCWDTTGTNRTRSEYGAPEKRTGYRCPRGLCKRCGKERSFGLPVLVKYQMCAPCWFLTGREGTRAEYGAPETKTAAQHLRKMQWRVKKFNELRAQGMILPNIAPLLHFNSPTALRKFLEKAKVRGFEIVQKPYNAKTYHFVPDNNNNPKQVPHGGGVRGRNKCSCDPCRLKRSEHLKVLYQARKAQKSAV